LQNLCQRALSYTEHMAEIIIGIKKATELTGQAVSKASEVVGQGVKQARSAISNAGMLIKLKKNGFRIDFFRLIPVAIVPLNDVLLNY
jgi:hypothetical protein